MRWISRNHGIRVVPLFLSRSSGDTPRESRAKQEQGKSVKNRRQIGENGSREKERERVSQRLEHGGRFRRRVYRAVVLFLSLSLRLSPSRRL